MGNSISVVVDRFRSTPIDRLPDLVKAEEKRMHGGQTAILVTQADSRQRLWVYLGEDLAGNPTLVSKPAHERDRYWLVNWYNHLWLVNFIRDIKWNLYGKKRFAEKVSHGGSYRIGP